MRYRALESIAPEREKKKVVYDSLMLRRVRNILLVASQYDSFTFEEDGRLTEALFSEYLELNLRYAPNIVRVSTAEDALDELETGSFDLVISMLRVGDMDVAEFGRAASRLESGLPIVLLTYNTRELELLQDLGRLPGIDRVFVWLGDVRLFLAIIKYVEDRINVIHDARAAGVQSIILVEDNPRFYSAYLPLAYTELVRQTQNLMVDGLNRMDKMIRMRARPKLLLATSYEEGENLFRLNRNHVAGVILDAAFPKDGKLDDGAGIQFAKMVRETAPDRPVLIQSSDVANKTLAHSLGAHFINKRSTNLLRGVRRFMRDHMGFGDFIFRMPGGKEIGRSGDLSTLIEKLAEIPVESLIYHVARNDFSTWLMARTEFDLAKVLRPRRVEEFDSPEDIRRYLIAEIDMYRDRSRAGVVADFSRGTFKASSGFMRIGSGSLGGKGRGLAFMYSLLEQSKAVEKSADLNIFVPPTVVVATGVFDEIMLRTELTDVAFGESSDEEIARVFIETDLPEKVLESLRTFLGRAHYPLAVRSSSLLEDASYQPFAGLYRTYMIPNNHEDIEVRLLQLTDAIKLVYASTFYANARSYIVSTPNRLEEEKMAVVIQQVVGRRRGNYVYPDIAGVVRSYNFYPMDGMRPEEGVASVVLGLGKAVVDGGRSIRFSPKQPRRLYQFSSAKDTLASAQREFLALDLSNDDVEVDYSSEEMCLTSLDLDMAEKDGILPMVGSVYSNENEAIYDGTSRPGVRLVTMAGVLKAGVYPLAETLTRLLEVGVDGFSSHVEIEFAANIREDRDAPHEFAFLQIRPVVVGSRSQDINADSINSDDTICLSHKALGNGLIEDVCDIVYVPLEGFERNKTVEIAGEIGSVTGRLRAEERPFMLIGPGRWGSADRWLGIPVVWSQISGVRCFVETDMADIRVTPSQGTHFFQNITSLGIGYFTLNFDDDGGILNSDWLDAEPAEFETENIRHLRYPEPLEIVVSGRSGMGVVMKPGSSVFKSEELVKDR
ncbi:MAG: histidine kinase [Deltaproteobacteria bacterium]|nr:histidine kinase [Deltaproteobacteria bacterium]